MDAAAHRDWIADRDRVVWGRHGLASLAATHWLDDSDRACDGVPGVWHTYGVAAIGRVDGISLRLAPGEEAHHGDVLLRGFARDGAIAVRAYDPALVRGGSAIERAPYHPAYRVTGVFSPAVTSEATLSVDGHRSSDEFDGTVALSVDGHRVELTVQRDDDGLSARFSDATSGVESFRFRFLDLPLPDADGAVEVDFNRAYLPPCAFSDHYLCVLPPAGNRWTVRVPAGELQVR
ncbi:MAG: DUF1684 domain-containing protein [Gemmatimonadota bacterium]|nr:DUF1684 domain-containing protein [Gemmatimonadota bacterium]